MNDRTRRERLQHLATQAALVIADAPDSERDQLAEHFVELFAEERMLGERHVGNASALYGLARRLADDQWSRRAR